MIPNDPKNWSLDYTLGYQAGFTRGMGVHRNALETVRQAQKDFDATFDKVVDDGNAQVIQKLDSLIIEKIENGDTPIKP